MQIHIAAAGYGTRMRGAIEELGFGDLPKHLLPTGESDGTTLLSRNLDTATAFSDDVVIHANSVNYDLIRNSHGGRPVPFITDTAHSPLGVFSFIHYMKESQTTASIAADVFIDQHDWPSYVASHDASAYPVSFLVGEVNGSPSNAVFDIAEDGRIERFYRLNDAKPSVHRNIGVYILTLTPPVVEVVQPYVESGIASQQDQIVVDLVAAGLVRAHTHEGRFFNINGRADYEALLAHTSQLVVRSEVSIK